MDVESIHCTHMKKNTDPLGMFEQLVMTAVTSFEEDPYAVPIFRKVCEMAGREVNIGAVYATLDRMEDKGYLKSYLGPGTPERGGKPKRFYKRLPAGRRV